MPRRLSSGEMPGSRGANRRRPPRGKYIHGGSDLSEIAPKQLTEFDTARMVANDFNMLLT
eukprot:3705837-Pyramimonas_sp.AAC.1